MGGAYSWWALFQLGIYIASREAPAEFFGRVGSVIWLCVYTVRKLAQ